MDIALALAAAVLFAFGSVLQQKGTLETDDGAGRPSFLIQILREPVWLVGGLCQASGWVVQAGALRVGPLASVQAVTTLSLVIALPIGVRLTNQRITPKVVAGASAVTLGIVVFLFEGAPQGGTSHPSAEAWWSAGIVTVVLVVGTALIGRGHTGSRRALLFGAAAGFGFALQSAVTKQLTEELGNGLGALLASWPVYVLIASAISGFVLQQSALKTGVLAPAVASSNAVTLFAGVILGVTVFGETLSGGGSVATRRHGSRSWSPSAVCGCSPTPLLRRSPPTHAKPRLPALDVAMRPLVLTTPWRSPRDDRRGP